MGVVSKTSTQEQRHCLHPGDELTTDLNKGLVMIMGASVSETEDGQKGGRGTG